jgi:hypothetical protein
MSIEQQMNELQEHLRVLDGALVVLARHEREATGDTFIADTATKKLRTINGTLFEAAQ